MGVSVKKAWENDAVYISASSPLGSPFHVKAASQDAIDFGHGLFVVWLTNKIVEKDPVVLRELTRLARLAYVGEVVLGYLGKVQYLDVMFIKAVIDHHIKTQYVDKQ